MEALSAVNEIADSCGMQVDMNNGTGWPFGGPGVTVSDAACKALFVDTVIPASALSTLSLEAPEKDRQYATLQCLRSYPVASPDSLLVIALFTAPTRQKVKRAAPGGEGYVVDHFSREAVGRYLERFDSAFTASGTPWPATFFNDSYEVYGANWTPKLLEEFAKRRGYRLEDKLPELIGLVDDANATLVDYRRTLGELLYENFTTQWVDWAHSHGVEVRNQAHGSPANLLDIYGAVDIPEIEGFGLSQFNIDGLRQDPGFVRKNDSDVSMLKYASSAAHVMGKPLVSSETFTWLTEHFRTSLSQMKPDLDLMFTTGVNRVFFHGTCYSPREAEWPGWRFYASIDMSPANSIWRDAPELMKYIERCQSFLQLGRPDNDFLVYLPVADMWSERHNAREKGLLMMFAIHSMGKYAPEFINSILRIDSLGYDCDYISDRQLEQTRLEGDRLVAPGGDSYKALIIPTGTTVTPELQALIDRFGDRVIMGEDAAAMNRLATPEPMRASTGLRAIRRSNATGHHYFIANLSGEDIDTVVPLAVDFAEAALFNPMTGAITTAAVTADGRLPIALRSGESVIIRTFRDRVGLPAPKSPVVPDEAGSIDLTPGRWQLSFVEESPRVDAVFDLDGLSSWEKLDNDSVKVTAGTGVYTTTVNLDGAQTARSWALDLGDVRESARVYINGRYVATAWAAPFVVDCGNLLRKGDNVISIEVTNLPANRIADLDRRGVEWRKMKEINVVDINYKKTRYDGWAPVASGLNSTVRLIPYNN